MLNSFSLSGDHGNIHIDMHIVIYTYNKSYFATKCRLNHRYCQNQNRHRVKDGFIPEALVPFRRNNVTLTTRSNEVMVLFKGHHWYPLTLIRSPVRKRDGFRLCYTLSNKVYAYMNTHKNIPALVLYMYLCLIPIKPYNDFVFGLYMDLCGQTFFRNVELSNVISRGNERFELRIDAKKQGSYTK